MRNTRRLLCLGAVALVVGALAWPAPRVPDFKLEPVGDESLWLKDLQGQAVLIKFSSSTCGPCLRDIPRLQDFLDEWRSHGENQDIAFYSVFPWDDKATLRRMAEKYTIRYPMVPDQSMTVSRSFGKVRTTPHYFLISPGGRLVWNHHGSLNLNVLGRKLFGM